MDKRLNAWRRRGIHAFEDVAQYHPEIGLTGWFKYKPKLQPTWNKLIKILLSSNSQLPTTEQVREYQKILLGRANGDTFLVELLPLASPSMVVKCNAPTTTIPIASMIWNTILYLFIS